MKHISILSFIFIIHAVFISTANSQSLDVLSSPEEEAQSFGMNLITHLFHENYVYFKDDISNDISYYWCNDPFDLECGGIDHFKDSYSKHLNWDLETSMNNAEFTFFGPTKSVHSEVDDTGGVIQKESTNMHLQWAWVTDDADFHYILFKFTLDENNNWKLTEIGNLPMN